MVIVRLIGGLGNQLFQYAAGRRLAHVLNTTLKLDITGFETYRLRTYSLSHFNIAAEIANQADISRFRPMARTRFGAILNGLKGRITPCFRFPIIREQEVGAVRQDVLKARGDVYLDGYWQSEKYFIDIQEIIRLELTIRNQPDPVNRKLADHILSCNAVSIHIRRGDYVNDPLVSKLHNTCGLDYYQKCISEIAESIERPQFFVFSDDPLWVRDNLHLSYQTTWVDHNDSSKALEDLRLMSLCRHHIISNSSFSWWGAWLNKKPGKSICAPMRWFNDSRLDARDIIPEGWRRL